MNDNSNSNNDSNSNNNNANAQHQVDEKLNALKKEYDDDFYSIYKIYVKGIEGNYQLTKEEQQKRIQEAKQQAKEMLLKNNPKYVILQERGMIE